MNKPVAWINVEKRRLEWDKPIIWKTPTVVKLDRIPLYTHPVKELTDEEIAVAHVPLMAWEMFSSSLFRLENNEITNDEFIKRCYEVVKARCNHPQPDYTQNNTQSHPVKELTDEKIDTAIT